MSSITTTNQLLKEVSEFVDTMNTDNSTTYKAEVFKKYSDKHPDTDGPFLRLMVMIYDKLVKFNVTSKNILKYKNAKSKKRVRVVTYKDDDEDLALFKMLEDLNESIVTGHSALASVLNLCDEYKEHTELILNILDKDLKTRFTAKNINKVVKDLVPVFDVSLGESYKDCVKYLEKPYKNGWYISRKLDGVRCICMIKFGVSHGKTSFDPTSASKKSKTIDNFFSKSASANTATQPSQTHPKEHVKIEFYSRQGKRFLTLKKLEEDIQKNLATELKALKSKESKGFVLDGEVCKIASNGLEDFQGIMKEINKKNHVMTNPKYLLFDLLTLEEFNRKTSERLLSTRLATLSKAIDATSCQRLTVIQQVPFTDKGFEAMQEQVKDNKWEGLILRKNDVYQGKRSKDILKVKQFFREEYKVEDVEFDMFRVINSETGLEEEIELLKAVTIKHKGYAVSVGSGFKLNERKEFHDNPDLIKGKVISVQFFEETTDKNGELSLRFPTYQGLYGKKRTF